MQWGRRPALAHDICSPRVSSNTVVAIPLAYQNATPAQEAHAHLPDVYTNTPVPPHVPCVKPCTIELLPGFSTGYFAKITAEQQSYVSSRLFEYQWRQNSTVRTTSSPVCAAPGFDLGSEEY